MLRADAPAATKDGGFVNAGVSPELDELRDIAAGGRDRIAAIEARERERTGIPSLKVKYNNVFGYYIEVTRAHLASVPADYLRKQTVANAERFVTPELAEFEQTVLTADERRIALELEIFAALRAQVAAAAEPAAHAGGARSRPSTRWPRWPRSRTARLLPPGGRRRRRHRSAPTRATRWSSGWRRPAAFVPNDVRLDPAAEQLLLVTGPNMAGKSTLIRQVALAVILAQMGGFVPARGARIGICDRVFTRVGAGDNLARGESTFMVEMRETAHILRHATARSLIVLDEIGRGTSTYDGVSIAWAVAEHLHDRRRREDAVRDPLPRAGRAGRRRTPRVRNCQRRGARVEGRGGVPAQADRRRRQPVVRRRGGEAGRPAAGGGRAGARDPADARVGRGAAGADAPRPGRRRPRRRRRAQLGLFSATAAAAGVPERAPVRAWSRGSRPSIRTSCRRAPPTTSLAELAKKLTPGS